ncbi:MAG: RHS repeat-associated core domain-containing protein [Polyangiaceae bacterium]
MFPIAPSRRACPSYVPPALLGSLFLLAACGGGDKHEKPSVAPNAETQCTDGKDNDKDGKSDCDDKDCQSPGGDCADAPALDRTVATTVGEAATFLYLGDNPLQKDADPTAFEAKRVAMLRGRVIDAKGEPIAGARVSIAGHKEFGYTLSRSDGFYDLAVNGGSRLLVDVALADHLAAQRVITPGWQRQHYLGEVGLIEASDETSRVSAGSGDSQAISGPSRSDDYGDRKPLVIFQPDTEARAVLADGSEEKLSSLTVTVTEFPIADAQQYLPGSPQATGLSYGLDFTVKEAKELGASHVAFSSPVSIYVENFLGLPVGTNLPLGYYDSEKGQWEQGSGGQVIEVVDVEDGRAVVDVDGDGAPESLSQLEDLGITESDLEQLAKRYEAGTELMQGRVSHFSAYAAQVNLKAPKGALPPNAASLQAIVDRPTRRGAVLVEPRAVVQDLPITGTSYSLTYQSNRTTGFEAGFTMDVPIVPAVVPPGLKRATAQVSIAGRVYTAKFEAKPNQVYTVTWDGLDAFGRLRQGPERAEIFVSYVYNGVLPNGTKPKKPIEVTLGQKIELQAGLWDFKGFELGGFGLDVLHAYHPGLRTVFFGDGDQRSADNVALVTKRANQIASFNVGTPDSVYVLPDGSLLVTDDQQNDAKALGRVLKISPSGKPSIVAGPGATGAAASVQLGQPQGVVALDDGSLVIADIMKKALRRIDAKGKMTTIASGTAGDKPEIAYKFTNIDGLAVGPREELYVVDGDRILRLEGQTLTTFAGGGTDLSDGIAATEAQIMRPSGVAVATDGTVYLSDREGHRIRAVLPDGSITTLAGKGTAGFSGDGGAALEAELSSPRGLALGPDGSLYVVDQGNNRIRRVTPDGLIQTVIGGGTNAIADGLLATYVKLDEPDGIAMGADGTLYVATKSDVLSVAPGLPELSEKETLIPSSDGSTLFRFDHRGKHLATIDAVTGVTELEFGYDAQGFLRSIFDESGLETTIERDAEHHPTAIVAPYGQRTKLEVSDDGWFAKVTDPIERSFQFTWNSKSGLLDKVVDPTQKAGTFKYDVTGRLENVTDPTGYQETIKPLPVAGGTRGVVVTTSGGKATEYSHKTNATGGLVRTVKANGDQVTSTELSTSRAGVLPDGTQVMTYLTPDTAFGSQSMIPSETTVKLPSGKSLTTSFQRTKNVTDVENALSVETWREDSLTNNRAYSSEYRRSDRTLTTTTPMGRSSTTTFDSLGHPVKVVAAGMPTVELAYDEDGRVTSISQTAGGKTRTQMRGYGADGWLASATDAIGHVVAYDWDSVGRPEVVMRPDKSTIAWTFDAADNVTSLTTPAKQSHQFDYDSTTNLLTKVIPPAVEQASPALSAGQKAYAYGLDHELTGIIFSDGRGIRFGYNAAGQLQSQTLGKASLSFGYTKGQLTSVNRSDGVKVDMTYDGALPTGTTWSGAITGSVKADYDTNLWLKALTVNNASTVSFSYDNDGLLVGASSTAGAMAVARDASTGRVTGTILGNVATSNGYNGFAELENLTATVSGTAVFRQSIERDELGRVVTIKEQLADATHILRYGYDNLGRLTSAERDGVVTTYGYDANGNRISVQTGKEEAVAATYDAQDRIQTSGSKSFEFFPHGDLKRTNDGTSTGDLEYDELGNLTSIEISNGTATRKLEYVVDGLGRRVGRKDNGVFDRKWLYRDGLRPIAEIDSAGVFTHFVYADSQSGAPDFMIRSGVLYRIIKDHLGSVRLVVNASTGVIAQSLEYDAFGRMLANTNPDFQPFGFAGGLYDSATGLVRFGARDYAPAMGRWANKDPIGFAGGDTNVYAYVGNDPVNGVDLSGLKIVPTDFIGPLAQGDQRGLTCAQEKALHVLVSREKKYGTESAARRSSNTWGDRLLEPFNSSDGHSVPTEYGDMDLDWFTDVRMWQQTSVGGRISSPFIYMAGKAMWSLGRKGFGVPIGNALPYSDPAERVASVALLLGVAYRDLFTPAFFSTYRPEHSCR